LQPDVVFTSARTTSGRQMTRLPASPLGVGDAAPDFALADPVGGAASTLSALRGGPVLLVLASPHWDPARDELAALYPSGPADAPPPRVVVEERAEIARLYGVHDATALFVIDERGTIRWRYVAGVDAMPQSSVASTSPLDDVEHAPLTLSRRDFVQAAVAAATLLAATALLPRRVEAAARALEPDPHSVSGATQVTLNVNGRPLTLDVEPRVTLLDALRERAALTGAKKGCDHGQCGACTVHVDGRRVLSCLTFAVMIPPTAKITTIEGLANGDTLHPVQQAFITHDGFQCGFCTSGQIMSAAAMLKEPWGSADDDVREAMSGNICRCGAYPGIVAAVQSVRSTATSEAKR
jgi:xanthine dehydrogenase YagT iron-sulfur-binding subunit